MREADVDFVEILFRLKEYFDNAGVEKRVRIDFTFEDSYDQHRFVAFHRANFKNGMYHMTFPDFHQPGDEDVFFKFNGFDLAVRPPTNMALHDWKYFDQKNGQVISTGIALDDEEIAF